MGVGGVGGHRDISQPEPDAAEGATLPRSGWSDQGALSKAVDGAKAAVDAGASRPNHKAKWVEAKRTSSGTGASAAPVSLALAGGKKPAKNDKPDKPVITAKYGVPANHGGGGSPSPVITAKYGVPANWGGNGGPTKPVITAKYGVPANHGGGGGNPSPIITAKYGVPANWGGGGNPSPVIVAKYGMPANIGGHRHK